MARWNRLHSGLWTQELEPALFHPGHEWVAARKGSTFESACGDGGSELDAIVSLHDKERAMGTMRLTEKICIWLAWHLPRQLVYWCALRVMTNTRESPVEWTCGEAARTWLQAKV